MRLSNFGAVRRLLLVSAVLTLFAFPVTAQMVERSQTWASLIATHPCNAGLNGRHTILTDAQSSSSIGGGGGSVRVFVECDGVDTWSIVSIGGGGVDLSAYVLLAGDEDGQTIQGLTGGNKARLELSPESEPTAVRMVGGDAANTAVVFVDRSYAGLRSPDTNSDCSVANGAVSCNSDNSVAFGVNPNGGYFGANPTGFYFGGPTVNIASSQTPPTNANDACAAGDTIDTATFHYYCAATDTWVRVAMATW